MDLHLKTADLTAFSFFCQSPCPSPLPPSPRPRLSLLLLPAACPLMTDLQAAVAATLPATYDLSFSAVSVQNLGPSTAGSRVYPFLIMNYFYLPKDMSAAGTAGPAVSFIVLV